MSRATLRRASGRQVARQLYVGKAFEEMSSRKRTQPRAPWRRPSYQSQSVARSRPGASRESVLRVSSVGPEEKSQSLKSARSTTREEGASHGDVRRRTRGNGARQLRADRARATRSVDTRQEYRRGARACPGCD